MNNTNLGTAGASGGAAGSVTILIAWILSGFHVQLPPEVAAAMVSLLGIGIHYLATRSNYPVPLDSSPAKATSAAQELPLSPVDDHAAVARALGVAQQPCSV